MKRATVLLVSVALGLALPRAAGAAERDRANDAAAASASEYAAHAGRLRDAPAARLAASSAAAALPVASDRGTWHQVGPMPYNNDDPLYPSSLGPFGVVSGQVISLAAVPTSPDVVYAGGAGGGIWKSSDGGAHWTPVGDGLPSMAIGALAVDPDHPLTVFAGTGNPNANQDGYGGTGVYRSHDGGGTWERVTANVGTAAAVFHIEVGGGRVFVATTNGLWRSTNGGDTYENVQLPTNGGGTAPASGDFANVVSDVRMKPGAPDEITAAVGWIRGGSDAPGNGLYRSTSGGTPGSFQRMTVAGLGLPTPSGDPLGRISLAYASGPGQDHNILWAVVQDAGLQRSEGVGGVPLPAKYTVLNGVFRSADDGATWGLKATPEELLASPGTSMALRGVLLYAPGVQSWYNQWIAVDPGDADAVLVGLEEIYKTTANANGPGPAVWQSIGRYSNPCPDVPTLSVPPCPPGVTIASAPAGTTTHPDQHAVSIVALGNATRVYIGSDGGAWRQDATGGGFDNDHWLDLNKTLGTLQPYRAAMASDGTIYFGLQDNGVGKTTGPTSGSAILGGDGMNVAVDPSDPRLAYAEGAYGSLSRTADGGINWTSIAPTTLTNPLFVAPFDLDPLDSNHFVLGAREVYASDSVKTASGGGWAKVYDVGTAPDGIDNSTSATAVRGAATYVGWCGHCNLLTDAGGDPKRFTNGIATNVKDGCEPTATTAACWHNASARGLPTRWLSDLAIDPADSKIVFAAVAQYSNRWYRPQQLPAGFGSGHLYVSTDAGESFSDASGSLPDSPATAVVLRGGDIVVSSEDGVFIANRRGNSVGSFARLGSGLPHAAVWDLQLDPSGSHLVAATHGRGVWVFDFAATAPAPAPIPRGVIPVTGRSGDQAAVAVLIVFALLLRVASRERRGSRRRHALSAR